MTVFNYIKIKIITKKTQMESLMSVQKHTFHFKRKRLVLNKITQSLFISLIGCAGYSSIVYAEDIPTTSGTAVTEASTSNSQSNSKADDVIQLADVIVTTRRREEKAQNVPTPISILSAKTLETQKLSKLEDLQQALPSLNVAFLNPRQSSVAVRGLGNNPASDGLEASVGVYLDNVYLGRPGMAVFDLLDIAQLELLRGPQGTLFGKNTTAGLLNISSKQPTFDPDHSAEISFGSRNYLQAKGTFSDALSENVAGRLSFYKTTQDGFIHNTYNGKDYNNTDREGVRGQILWKPQENFNLRLIADYNKQDDDQGAMVVYYAGPTFNSTVYGNNYNRYLENATQSGAKNLYTNWKDKQIHSDAPQHMSVEQGGGSAEANWSLDSGKKITSISAYRFWNFTPTNSDFISSNALTNAGVSVRDKQYSQELRLTSAGNQKVDWVTGLYYFQQQLDNTTFSLYGDTADAFYLYNVPSVRTLIANGQSNILNNRDSYSYGTTETKSSALFGQSTWHATPKLDITTGARVTYEDKSASIYRTDPIGGTPVSGLSAAERNLLNAQLEAYDSGELKQHGLSYSGLLTGSYRLNPSTLAYATYSHGEKSGGFNLSIGSAPTAGANSLKVDPEKADNYEIGLKQNFLNNTLQLNSNIFWIDVSDYQTTSYEQVGNSVVSVLANAGKVRSRGIELDATYQPIRRLTLNFNGSLNDTTYTEYKNAPAPSNISIPTGVNTQDLSGERVYGVPKWIANFNFRYDLAEHNNWQPYVSGSYAWRDWSYGSLDNNPYSVIKAYGLTNASLGARHRIGENELDVALWVKNLANETYVTNTWNSSNGIVLASLGQPRTIGATVKLSF